MRALKVFFCYAREDEILLNKLKKYLSPLRRAGSIEEWHDRNISPGAEWGHEIDTHLSAADIILLLVSPDFMDSDYCYGIEVQRAMERHLLEEAYVIPVILRPIRWQDAPFGKIQALPTDAKPIMSSNWHYPDEAFFDVAEGIYQVVQRFAVKPLPKDSVISNSASVETSQPSSMPESSNSVDIPTENSTLENEEELSTVDPLPESEDTETKMELTKDAFSLQPQKRPLLPPAPETTLVVLLGASEWPYMPELSASQAFTNSANAFKGYFLSPQTFGLPQENLLNLFDTELTADDIDATITQFIETRASEMRDAGHPARDVLISFIGQSGFFGNSLDFYLTIRRTRSQNPAASSIPVDSLVTTLNTTARRLRRFLILDCAFAAAALKYFVNSSGEGISIFCSSSPDMPSLISPNERYTMFSEALLHVLDSGKATENAYLSLREVYSLVRDFLYATYSDQVPMPELHSPNQSVGDVATLPLFPNLSKDTGEALLDKRLQRSLRLLTDHYQSDERLRNLVDDINRMYGKTYSEEEGL